MPRMDMVDTSNNNGYMTVDNWRSMKKRGVKAMVAKLSEGTYFVDKTAAYSIANALKAGLYVNGYHFARFATVDGAKREAQMAVRCALGAGLGKNAVIVLDFEATNSGWNQNAKIVKAWINEVHRLGYPKTDVYTMGSWINSVPLNNSGRGGWVANYPYNPSGFNLYTGYNGWQWTSSMKFAGCAGRFDVSQMYSNYYYGESSKKKKHKKAIYYRYNPKYVYSRSSINSYTDKAFKHKAKSYPAKQIFHIKRVVKYGKITRFELFNGKYITSNLNFVNRLYYSLSGGVKVVKSVKGTHRFKDVGLKKVVDWFPAGTEFSVKEVVKYGEVTRIKLVNGMFISANKLINSFVE